ncbi:uncharacterized protein K460DRAFT_406455 [Cucurbitaria berberidis CBS 394.84]|uniref:Uncharacterized protein n=1 Tax=Cucurbitaria berberidis CBS 394.84 TaxID=1168544 RepID=A0A9P4GJ49_9PLEO|nr:uncharacterized protein K460DRAFT_406455 [Cucurbitaria berberidis CBS 394.84]KAF1846237.1 hypothetical protein K460DRAFT_406455 [Cucurbitaria berberidis CBS 394.84]
MTNPKGHVIKVEHAPTPSPATRAPDINLRADLLPPMASPTIPAHGSHARPTTNVLSDFSSGECGQPATEAELTPEQVVSLYTGPYSTHYMASIVDGGNYWEKEGRPGTLSKPTNAPPYNHELRPIHYTDVGAPQAYRQYAGVPAAHNMIPAQAPLQNPEIHKFGDNAPARPTAFKTPVPGKGLKKSNRINRMVLPDMALPENSDMSLNFTNLREARDSVLNRDLDCMPPSPDLSIPKTDEQRAGYVLRLLLAMRNRDDVLDKDVESKRYNATGTDDMGGGYYYKEEDMEKVCWEIVNIAEKLHIHGPNILSIYDRETLRNIKRDINFTFEERMQCLIKMLCFFKSRCDAFMKGSAMEETVAQPLQKLTQALTNRNQNDKRAKIIAAGRKVRKDLREDTATPDRDELDNNVDTGAEQPLIEPRATQAPEHRHTWSLNQDVHMGDQEEDDIDTAMADRDLPTDEDL